MLKEFIINSMDSQSPAVEAPSSQVYTAPQSPPTAPKSFLSSRIVLLVVILLILFGAGGTYLALNSKPKPAPILSKETPTPTPTPIDETATWKTYTNSDKKFSIKYPPTWKVYDCSESAIKQLPYGAPGQIIYFEKPEWGAKVEWCGARGPTTPAVSLDFGGGPEEYQAKISSFRDNISKLNVENFQEEEIIISNRMGVKFSYLLKVNSETYQPYGIDVDSGGYIIDAPGHPVKLGYVLPSPADKGDVETIEKIFSTLKFLDTSPTPTCRPRPACLDATPRCLIPETSDMCPKAIVCTQEAKLCPDGSYVGRQEPNCEFAPCPGQ